MAAEEEEVVAELEAVQAVYGDDCLVLDSYPPHLHLRIKPRTADVTSQQFVEAVIGLQASSQYPKEQPQIDLIDSKGLDEQRQKLLLSLIQDKACELSSCLMLVALCEEAVEQLTLMNHPDGDCPLCLNPLVEEDEQNNTLPFMKLMSCLHCFHSECIIRWWNWLQTEHITNPSDSSTETTHTIRDMGNKKDTFGDVESMGNCPVCRKVFQTKDFEHVRDLVGSHSSQLSYDVNEVNGGEKLLHSESENIRRQRFEAILKLQQEHNGLIEPKRNISVSPGMFPSQPVTMHSTVTNKSNEQEQKDSPSTSEMNTGDTSERPDTSMHRNPGMRKQRVPVKQWIRKENAESENIRGQRFDAILKLQQEHNGLIEPKRNIGVSPGMFPSQQPVTTHSTVTDKSNDQDQKDSPSTSEMNTGDTSERPDTSMHRNAGMGKQRVPVKQWIRKENARAE